MPFPADSLVADDLRFFAKGMSGTESPIVLSDQLDTVSASWLLSFNTLELNSILFRHPLKLPMPETALDRNLFCHNLFLSKNTLQNRTLLTVWL